MKTESEFEIWCFNHVESLTTNGMHLEWMTAKIPNILWILFRRNFLQEKIIFGELTKVDLYLRVYPSGDSIINRIIM